MSTRSSGRELAFLAIGQISKSTVLSSEELILAATRTLKGLAKNQLKRVQKDLKILGEYFFLQQSQEQQSDETPVSLQELHNNVAKLELACFEVLESLELPELLNQKQEAFDFAAYLVDSYRSNKAQIHEIVSNALESERIQKGKGWSLDRVIAIDRTLLKLATTEILFNRDIPMAVLMDETVNLADKYGTEQSPRFVNGVLADIHRSLQG